MSTPSLPLLTCGAAHLTGEAAVDTAHLGQGDQCSSGVRRWGGSSGVRRWGGL